MAVNFDISAFKRVPFADDIAFLGHDWTGATLSMHIRNRNGDQNIPLVSLANSLGSSQGLSISYDPAYVYNQEGNISAASKIYIRIDELTLEGLSLNNPYCKPSVLKYDVHITPIGGIKRVILFGEFIIYPGSTI